MILGLFPAMGSSMSEVVCSLVAAFYEYRFDARTHKLISEGFLPRGTVRVPDFVKSLGHVDDFLSQSRIHCRVCLNRVQQ